MVITMSESLADLTEYDLANFEHDFDLTLPKQYRQFLLKQNGGCPTPNTFNYSQTHGCTDSSNFQPSQVGIVNCFFSIDSTETMSLARMRTFHLNMMPNNLLPIADTVTGNVVCLSVNGPNVGFVYIWHHDEGRDLEEWEEPNCDYIYFVADNFDTFLNSLYEYKAES